MRVENESSWKKIRVDNEYDESSEEKVRVEIENENQNKIESGDRE